MTSNMSALLTTLKNMGLNNGVVATEEGVNFNLQCNSHVVKVVWVNQFTGIKTVYSVDSIEGWNNAIEKINEMFLQASCHHNRIVRRSMPFMV